MQLTTVFLGNFLVTFVADCLTTNSTTVKKHGGAILRARRLHRTTASSHSNRCYSYSVTDADFREHSRVSLALLPKK